jgi:hypothetical protein
VGLDYGVVVLFPLIFHGSYIFHGVPMLCKCMSKNKYIII